MNLPDYWIDFQTSRELPLVLLHGFLGAKEDWNGFRSALAPAIDVLSLDLAGHGSNPQDDCSFEAMARQIWHDLEQQGIQKIHLLGYSMGGRLGLYLLSQWPERIQTLILLSASAGLKQPAARQARAKQDEILAQGLESQPFEDFLARWYQQPLFAGLRALPDFETILAQRLATNRPERLARSLRQAGTGVAPSVWEQLSDIRQPILFISGRDDQKFCQIGQKMAGLCPELRPELVPGGHCPHLEAPDQTLALIRSFLGL